MLEVVKNENGLTWGNKFRAFTKDKLENGYEKIDDFSINIELDSQLVYLDYPSVSIDGKTFTDLDEMINYIFT